MDRSVSVFRWVALLAGLLASTVIAPAQGLRVSDNGRFLGTDEEKPFFYLADTGW